MGQRGPQPAGAEPPYPGSGSSAVPPTSPRRGLGWKTRPGWETCSRLRQLPRAGCRCRCPPPLLGAAHPGSAHQGGRPANLGSGLEAGPGAVGSFFLSPVTHEQFVSPEGIRRADFPGLHPAQPSPPPPRHQNPGLPHRFHPHALETAPQHLRGPFPVDKAAPGDRGAGAARAWPPSLSRGRDNRSSSSRKLKKKKNSFFLFNVWVLLAFSCPARGELLSWKRPPPPRNLPPPPRNLRGRAAPVRPRENSPFPQLRGQNPPRSASQAGIFHRERLAMFDILA